MNERNPPRSPERDDIAALLRAAGKRAAVPDVRFHRARDAAQAEWRQVVAQRSRKRTIRVAVSLAAAAVVALALLARFVPNGPAGAALGESAVRVAAVSGAAWVDDAGVRRDLVRGESLAGSANTAIGTPVEGRVALTLASGHAVRLDRGTRVRLLDTTTIALDRGSVYVDSGLDGDPATTVTVHTPLGTVREIGTQFEVRLSDGGLRVRLREGAAIVNHEGLSHDVIAGGELNVNPDGSVSRGVVPTSGVEWEWLVDVTTIPPLDGRTARNFLDWVARERGLSLVFEDDTVARSADTIVLGGAADDLTVLEALDAVLPTCRLAYDIDDGVLVIAAE